MRLDKRHVTAACLALPCVLFLACGGTFCDEYPEACGAVGGTGSGEPFDVEVSLLDGAGAVVPQTPVLVSDPAGQIIEVQSTTSEGALLLTVREGDYISVFHDDGDAYAFTALATPDAPKLSFQLPAKSTNPETDIQVTGTCATNCQGNTELSVSCGAPVAVRTDFTNLEGALSDYVGCPSSAGYDAYLVGYDQTGAAVKASSASVEVISPTLSMPVMAPVEADGRFDFQMTLDTSLPVEGVTRTVRVPYSDRPGYGFSRASTDTSDTLRFSLVTELVPRAVSIFVVSLAEERTLRRQRLFDPVPADTTFVPNLAIPDRPPPLQTDDPSQPRAYYSLDGGPLTDALQLVVERGSLTWIVSLPTAAEGNFSFPVLPDELVSYLLADVDDYDVLHVDLDDAQGYAGFASKPILDYATDVGLPDLTIARSSR